jgi:CRISPR-associated endonuclease/helicase Cas3
MCPAHRTTVLDKVKACLDPKNPSPVICISTQLIEAGVDVDFGSVIRYLAGLDSIAQAAGRCNRNGRRQTGRVLVVNLANENLTKLAEIHEAQEQCRRVLGEYKNNPAEFDHDLQSPKAMERYYHYYFFKRAHEMSFPITRKEFGRDDDLLTLLSTNALSVEAYKSSQKLAPPLHLRQSFMTAAKAFKAIDSPTEGVIVQYGRGEQIIAELSDARYEGKAHLLKEAQRFSVNLFCYEVENLKGKGRLYETWEGSGIFWLDERHYSEEFGVSTEEVAAMKIRIV